MFYTVMDKYRFVLILISITIISLYGSSLCRNAKADGLQISPDQAKQIVRDWMPAQSMGLSVVSTGDVFYELCENGKQNVFLVQGISGVVKVWRNKDGIESFETLENRDISEKAKEEDKLPLSELRSITESFLLSHDPQYTSMTMVCCEPWTSCFTYAQRIGGNIINAQNVDNCVINEYTGELLVYEALRNGTPQLSALPTITSDAAQQLAYVGATQLKIPRQGSMGVAELGDDPALVFLSRERGLWALKSDDGSYHPYWLFDYVLSSDQQYNLQQYNKELLEGPGMTSGKSVTMQVDAVTGEANPEEGLFLPSISLSSGASPAIAPAAGTYSVAQTVTITSSDPNAVIRYTTDGTRPVYTSQQYTGPITISTTTTIKARAYIPNHRASEMVASTYLINP